MVYFGRPWETPLRDPRYTLDGSEATDDDGRDQVVRKQDGMTVRRLLIQILTSSTELLAELVRFLPSDRQEPPVTLYCHAAVLKGY